MTDKLINPITRDDERDLTVYHAETPCAATKRNSLVERLCERKATLLGSSDAPDPLCQEAKARILADAEVIKAAEALVSRLNKLQTYFDLTAEEFDSLTHDEQADTIRQHCLITEVLDTFNRAMQGRKGGE